MTDPQNPLNPRKLEEFAEIASFAAKKAGELLVDKMGKVTVREKQPGDYVTQADIDSQQTIYDIIQQHFPDHEFVGEEQIEQPNSSVNSPFRWIVDPLDGTTNFVHQLHSFSVSIGLVHDSRLVVGVVYDPLIEELYCAIVGNGATLNGQVIGTSRRKDPNGALLVCSFPTRVGRDSIELERFIRVICDSGASVRRLGSAALNLCYVAAGRLDGYWATSVKPWDVAAGMLILQEAGGAVCKIDGGPFDFEDPKFLAMSTDELLTSMKQYLVI